jgi:cell division protein FtsW
MTARIRALNLRGIDYPLLLTVAILLVLGLVMVYSASFGLQMGSEGRPTVRFLVRQAQWVAIGTVALVAMTLIDYRAWRRLSIAIMAGALLILVILLLLPSTAGLDGEEPTAQRWLLGNSVQPGEMVKLVVIIYVADWLASKGEKIRQLTYGMVPFAILLGIITGLIVLQPNFSTAFLIVCTAVAMFFVAGADVRQLVIGGLVGGASLAMLVRTSAYRWDRVMTFIEDPLRDPLGSGYQTAQAIYALQTGGPLGVGLGNSMRKMTGFLYAPHTDAIFAIIGEELGLLGALVIMGLYVVLAYRGIRIALRCDDPFGALLATGVTSWFVFQAFLHIAVVTATVPFTGVTLPFVSFGGSSLVALMAAVGLLLSVSRGASTGPRGVRVR